MSRAFLYMVVERIVTYPFIESQYLYTVHRINPSRLFFSNKDAAAEPAAGAGAGAGAVTETKARLPRPTLTFYPSFQQGTPMDFALVGRAKDRIVAWDCFGSALLYDDALRAVYALPSMKGRKQDFPVSLAVGDHLFVSSNMPHPYVHSVEALMDHRPHWPRPAMHWHPIPPPPYVKPEDQLAGDYSDLDEGYVEAYAAVGESQAWVSAGSYGTYSFDMRMHADRDNNGDSVSRLGQWSKVGDWVLPFQGRAVYAPELRLWFGFSKDDDDDSDLSISKRAITICAADLHQAGGVAQPPVVNHEWGFVVPNKGRNKYLDGSFLVHLGTGGRFCIANLFGGVFGSSTATLTGVEVTRCGQQGQDIRFVEHKTYRYGGLGRDQRQICLL